VIRETSPPRRPRVLVLNQYYLPGIEATARLLADLCAALASEYDVTVVTGQMREPSAAPRREVRDGVTIIRVTSTDFDRRRLLPRGINYVTYLLQSFRAALSAPRPDVVLTMTDPPVIGTVGVILARRFGVPLVVISQDVFPEIATQLRRLENPLVVGLLRKAVAAYLTRADRIVAIGETMRKRLEEKGADPACLRVIPNWVDATQIVPVARDNEWAQQHGFVGKFVVMHSGNVGHAQNLDTLIRAASFLRDLDDFSVVIIGAGARHRDLVELAEVLEVDAISFLPYQPRELLADSLSSGDLHFVGLGPGLAGYVVPSRLYGILAAGKPIIAAVDSDSETAGLVEQIGCGVVIPPSRPDLLAAEIRKGYEGKLDLGAMGRRAREYATTEATRDVALDRYRVLLSELLEQAPST
jgi:glycosyltransferase involved in cell wall biosynthesis